MKQVLLLKSPLAVYNGSAKTTAYKYLFKPMNNRKTNMHAETSKLQE